MPGLPVSNQELNLFEILGGIKRRFYLVVAFTILFLLFGILIIGVSPRKYEAQTLIALQTSEKNFGAANATMASTNMLLPPVESVVLSQVEMLQSRNLAEALVKEMTLDQDEQFWAGTRKPNNPERAKQKAIQNIIGNLAVKPVGRSLVIDIRYRHANAKMAAKIVNHYAAIFQEQQVAEKIDTARNSGLWLEHRLKTLSIKLRDSARAVEEYRAKENLTDGAKTETTLQRISEISTQLTQAQAEQAAILARKSQVEQILKDKGTLDNFSEIKDSHLVDLFKRDEAALAAQLAQMQIKYGPNHPKILSAKAELNDLNGKKNREIAKITGGIENEIVTINAKINILQENLKQAEDIRRKEMLAAIGLKELQREADANRDLYNNFLNRYKETRMLDDSQQPDTKIVSTARVPVEPSGPNPLLILMMTSFAGLIFGLLIALLLDQLETLIRTPEQLLQLTGMDTLAVIPKLHNSRKYISHNYVFDHPYAPVTEALRGLCIRLLGRVGQPPVTIALTSCLPEQGKTVTTLGMAKLMAKSGLRVILIDGNLRYPGLQKYLEKENQYSVADFIFKRTSLENVLAKDDLLPTLSILTGKVCLPDDITALSENVLQAMLAELKTQADIILIDAPSFQISESQLLNKVADHCLIVVHSDKTPGKIVSSVCYQMLQDKNKILGFIITENAMT